MGVTGTSWCEWELELEGCGFAGGDSTSDPVRSTDITVHLFGVRPADDPSFCRWAMGVLRTRAMSAEGAKIPHKHNFVEASPL